MRAPLNIISIYCHFARDCADPTEQAQPQAALKKQINQVFAIAFKSIGQANRTILVTGDDAAITYTGLPESAMVIAKDIVSGVLTTNQTGDHHLSVAIGMHAEPIDERDTFKKQPNYIVNGLAAAKQLASTALANEIVVSPAYTASVAATMPVISTEADIPTQSPAPHAFTNVVFEHHVLEYQVYVAHQNLAHAHLASVAQTQMLEADAPILANVLTASGLNPSGLNPSGLNHSQTAHSILATATPTFEPALSSEPSQQKRATFNWRCLKPWHYALASLFIVVPLYFILASTVSPLVASKLARTPAAAEAGKLNQANQANQPATPSAAPEASASASQQNSTQSAMTKKTAAQPQPAALPTKQKAKPSTKKSAAAKPTNTTNQQTNKGFLSWESFKKSFKQGQKAECTQVETAMNQCR